MKIFRLFIAILFCVPMTVHTAEMPQLEGTHRLNFMGRELPPPKIRARRASRSRNEVWKKGDRNIFKTFNFATNKWEETEAELVAAGTNLVVYLELARSFDEAMLQRLVKEFDRKIYPQTTRYFGNEARPGIDNDDRITILLMDIRDGFEKSGTYTSGYFNRGDCYLPHEIPEGVDLQSNCREMLYVDINPSDVSSNDFFATIAHEFQHLIHFYHDSEEYDWLNEGCSQLATFLCGYGHPLQLQAYLRAPDNSLLAWNPWTLVANYGQVYLWSYYVMNKYCSDDEERVKFFRELVANKQRGRSSFDTIFKQKRNSFASVFTDFCIAGFVNRPELKPEKYLLGKELEGFQLPACAYIDSFPATFRNNVSMWGSDLIKVAFRPGTTEIKVDFAGDLNNMNNEFTVALVFMSEKNARVCGLEFINNIKSTTPHRLSRVMLPDHSDGFPLPPPVKTQMGGIVASVPEDAETLYLVIIGKTPEDIADSMLAWSPKATYRIDIETKVSEARSGSQPVLNDSQNFPALLSGYIRLRNDRENDCYAAVAKEIVALLKAEIEQNSTDSAAVSAVLENSSLNELHRVIAELKTFSRLHN